MSFQHFRLGENAYNQPLPPHLQHTRPNTGGTVFIASNPRVTQTKGPYGSGVDEDGYTLVFENLAKFVAWRTLEEETQMVEFVKGDTHASKAVPPRFKDHTKLVCARHSRSGRKKYVKKHPERIRKVPSRKLEGQGCPASISYKTYFDTEEVRACYISGHSHEVGLANLPFTRRGRKAASKGAKNERMDSPAEDQSGPGAGPSNSQAGPSNSSSPSLALTGPPQPQAQTAQPVQPAPHPQQQQQQQPPPAQQQQQYMSHPLGYAQSHPSSFPVNNGYQQSPSQPQITISQTDHERWERMSVLFASIRDHARSYAYPVPSVNAMESVLVRLYLESPVLGGGQITNAMNQHQQMDPQQQQQQQIVVQNNHPQMMQGVPLQAHFQQQQHQQLSNGPHIPQQQTGAIGQMASPHGGQLGQQHQMHHQTPQQGHQGHPHRHNQGEIHGQAPGSMDGSEGSDH